MPTATIHSIYRYPVKGLSPEPLRRATLTPGKTIPGDRKYAIENGPSGFDPGAPSYMPKIRFLMLMRNESLARLATHYDDATRVLTISEGSQEVARGRLTTPEGRAKIEGFFAKFSAGDLRGPPKVLAAPDHSFSDVAKKVISIINLASVADVENVVDSPVDPLRFRANLYVEGWPAWHEFGLLGRTIAIGASRLKIVKRIVRCAAIDVDPATGIRDLHLPETLVRSYDHRDCGVYADVMVGGEIAPGQEIALPQEELRLES